MKPRTFAEIYCEREGLAPGEWPGVLFRRTLYPHARVLARIIRLVNRRHFLADHEFVEDVGHLRNLSDFTLVLGSYLEHPSNWGLLRRRLRVRVSARRMLAIVRTVFATPDSAQPPPRQGNTFEPFGGTKPGA
jgi:hypothetical protein